MESGDYMGEEKQAKPMPVADHGDGGVDHMSTLPDDVLVCILRLVGDARQVVRTSALARRWRGLWAQVAAIRFDSGPEFQSPSDAERFIAFVNNVLEQHAQRAGSGMEQMGVFLNVHYERGEPHLAATTVEAAEGWIRYAVQHELTSFAFVVDVIPKKWACMFNQQEEDHDRGELVEEEEDSDSSSEGDDEEVDEEEEKEEDSDSSSEGDDEEVDEEEEDDDDDEKEDKYSSDQEDGKKMPLIALDELLVSSPKLKTMHLSLPGTRVRLPSTSMIFTSLTELALEYLEIDSDDLLGRLLSPACCPCLQKLLLRAVKFKYTSMNEDTLGADDAQHEGMESLELRTPNLRSFKIEYCHDLERLAMSASRLEQLTFSHNYFVDDIYLDVPCLGRLGINLVSHMRYNSGINDNDASISVLNSCTSATCLVVDLEVPTERERRHDLIEFKMPQHSNITSLVVKIDTMHDRHSFGDGVAGLLTRFNNLRYLCLQLDEVLGFIKKDEHFSEDADGKLAFVCNHQDIWSMREISLSNLIRAEFRGISGTVCELRFLRFLLENSADLEKVTVIFSANNYNIEGWVDYFLNVMLEDGVWTANEDHLYEWRP